ncbi:uracil phosphoribosyltransferase [bacterium]|nr:MAG: uracil phosphoribosyltransferase [bacterium]
MCWEIYAHLFAIIGGNRMDVTILSNSLAGIFLTKLRDKTTSTVEFRQALKSLTTILFISSSEKLPVGTIEVETPLERTIGVGQSNEIILVPIIRAGISMVEPILDIFPSAKVMYIGAQRNETTLEIEPYYSSLNDSISDEIVYLLDPMLATGGTLEYSINELSKLNPSEINILTIICAPEGVERVSDVVDNLNIPVKLWTASIDRQLNERGFILPGLGDAGDRICGV